MDTAIGYSFRRKPSLFLHELFKSRREVERRRAARQATRERRETSGGTGAATGRRRAPSPEPAAEQGTELAEAAHFSDLLHGRCHVLVHLEELVHFLYCRA